MRKIILLLLLASMLSAQMVAQSVTIKSDPLSGTICEGSVVTLTAIPQGGMAIGFLWSTGETTSSIAPHPMITTVYTVTVTFLGGIIRSANITITVLPPPVATITPTGTTTICDGDDVELVADIADTYQWYLDGNPIFGATDQAYLASVGGSYTVFITEGSCSAMSSPIVVTIVPLPIASFSPMVFLDECSNSITPFTADLTGPNYNYQWFQSINGNTGTFYPLVGETAPVLLPDLGDFYYSLTVTNTITNCQSSW